MRRCAKVNLIYPQRDKIKIKSINKPIQIYACAYILSCISYRVKMPHAASGGISGNRTRINLRRDKDDSRQVAVKMKQEERHEDDSQR